MRQACARQTRPRCTSRQAASVTSCPPSRLGSCGRRPRGVGLPARPVVAPPAPPGIELRGDALTLGADRRDLVRRPAAALDPALPAAHRPSRSTSRLGSITMSSSRSCVSNPIELRLNGSWMFTYHADELPLAGLPRTPRRRASRRVVGAAGRRARCHRSLPLHGCGPPNKSSGGNASGAPSGM